ncbi:MAG: circadian clock protein KaiC [Thermodesulfobacteriota bacterium]|nr:MAG: circadian clock protein KaiC [Thermodesulfobacteriota bacterium]
MAAKNIVRKSKRAVEKIETGIEGFDLIADGGIPRGRACLVAGTAGSAKTIFAAQFLSAGIYKKDEPGVFVTFEEPPEDIRKNMMSFGWDIGRLEKEGKWAFVDASPQPSNDQVESGSYDFGALLARIEHAVRKIGASRVSMDSLGAVFNQFTDSSLVRKEIFRISAALKKMKVTAVLTAERNQEYGGITRFGIEEFVADSVVILRNVLEDEKRRRTVEILKFRGTYHQKGEFPFTIFPHQGIMVIPLSALELKQKSSYKRITSGSSELDRMCGGGFFRDSIVLVSGATGAGKTLIVTQFMNGGYTTGERCLLLGFEESREQLMRNATGWGIDFKRMEAEGKLKIACEYPEATSLEDLLIRIKHIMEEFKPHRVAVDSLSALERVSTTKGFREFVISLTSFIKHQEVAGLFTATTSNLIGGTSITEAHISTITDSIILLRYVEMYGEMLRGLTVLKMRGSMHDKDIREFSIDGNGMHIGKPFRTISGILTGTPMQIVPERLQRLDEMFKE